MDPAVDHKVLPNAFDGADVYVPDRLLGTRTWMLIARAEEKMCMWQKMRYVSRTRERPRHPSRFVRPSQFNLRHNHNHYCRRTLRLSETPSPPPKIPLIPLQPPHTHTNEYTPSPLGCDSVSKHEKVQATKEKNKKAKGRLRERREKPQTESMWRTTRWENLAGFVRSGSGA